MATELHSHCTLQQQQPNPFIGLRFALFGFSPVNQQQVKFKLVSGGGVDVGKYTHDCTHVIVKNLVYDDPVCVLAREDDKIVVTGLWVDHSLDIGMPVDYTSVMYRPLKDLNGIPGAKSLIMCLTGYQRQDRDDVMTMVGLMGAQFSKPLVANKITHLICYKFEGEKYELAKKMKRIKLVNHKWLEDCLSRWQILPESDYNKSGYELEMEIEAKDSEDEAEDKDSPKLMGRDINFTPQRIRNATPIGNKFLKPNAVMSKIPLESTGPVSTCSPTNLLEIPSFIGEDTIGGRASSSKDPGKKHDKAFELQNTVKTTAFAELPDRDDTTPISSKVGRSLASVCGASKSTLSGEGKSTSVTYSRKRAKSTPGIENPSNSNSSPKLQSDEQKTSDTLNISSYKGEQVIDRNNGFSFNTPLKRSPIQEKELSSVSPQKRKMATSYGSSKSQKIGQGSKPFSSVGTLAENEVRALPENEIERSNITPLIRSPSKINQFHSVNKSCSPEHNDNDGPAVPSTTMHSPAGLLKSKLSTYKRKSVTEFVPVIEIGEDNKIEKVLHNSYERLVEPSIIHKADNANALNSRSPVIPIGKDKNPVSKPQKKKQVANKTLGARVKPEKKAKSANLKGSLYLDRNASPNDDALRSTNGMQTVNLDEASGDYKFDERSNLYDEKMTKETVTISAPKSGNCSERKSELVDDETEAPDDNDLEKIAHTSFELAEIRQNKDVIMEERSEECQHMMKINIDNAVALEGDQEKEVDGKNIEFAELNCLPAAVKGKKTKVKNNIRKKDAMKPRYTNAKSPGHERKINGGDTIEKVCAKPGQNAKALKKNRPVYEVENAVDKSADLAETKQKQDITLDEISEEAQHMPTTNIDNAVSLKGDQEKVHCKNTELQELTSAPAGAKVKKTKVKKSIRKKDSTKTGFTDAESSEHGRTINGDDTTENVCPKPRIDGRKPNQDAKVLNKKRHVKEPENTVDKSADLAKTKQNHDIMIEERSETAHHTTTTNNNDAMPLEHNQEKEVHGKDIELGELNTTPSAEGGKKSKIEKCVLKKSKLKSGRSKAENSETEKKINGCGATEAVCAKLRLIGKTPEQNAKSLNKGHVNELENNMESEKENAPMTISNKNMVESKQCVTELAVKSKKKALKAKHKASRIDSVSVQSSEVRKRVISEPRLFILSGHRLLRKEFQKVIKQLRGKVCRDSHQWSYQATHFIAPDPLRRTEKFFAAAASGRWILKPDYLSASSQAGKLLEEDTYEWYKNGLSDDNAINMEAPRKWRLLREKTGHGAFYGMRIIIYGECIAPSLDTLKRAVKAGDGTILATSPPYTKFFNSGVDFAIIRQGMPSNDIWVQEFLKHEIPCVSADYLVEFVCKTGDPLEGHVLYGTHAWAENSLAKLTIKSEEIVEELQSDEDDVCKKDITCYVCGLSDRGEVMLICGDESGSSGCRVGSYINCCNPPLEDVPDEDWACPKCRGSKNGSDTRESSKKKTSKTKA